jgi:hypothetical protein
MVATLRARHVRYDPERRAFDLDAVFEAFEHLHVEDVVTVMYVVDRLPYYGPNAFLVRRYCDDETRVETLHPAFTEAYERPGEWVAVAEQRGATVDVHD